MENYDNFINNLYISTNAGRNYNDLGIYIKNSPYFSNPDFAYYFFWSAKPSIPCLDCFSMEVRNNPKVVLAAINNNNAEILNIGSSLKSQLGNYRILQDINLMELYDQRQIVSILNGSVSGNVMLQLNVISEVNKIKEELSNLSLEVGNIYYVRLSSIFPDLYKEFGIDYPILLKVLGGNNYQELINNREIHISVSPIMKEPSNAVLLVFNKEVMINDNIKGKISTRLDDYVVNNNIGAILK